MPKKILVIGDIIIDHYIHVTSTRNAQEANIPVFDETYEYTRLGGAANVAMNIKSLGKNDVDVVLAGIGPEVCSIQEKSEYGKIECLVTRRPSMKKTRYCLGDRIIFRCDNFKKFSQSSIDEFCCSMYEILSSAGGIDLVVISDYDKGTVTENVIKQLEKYPVKFVDSKRKDLRIFDGFKVLKLNEDEYSAQVSNRSYTTFESLFEYVVVTKGSKGSEIRQYDKYKSNDSKYVIHTEQFPVIKRNVVDVTGCGDTHTAAMAVHYTFNKDIRSAVKFANECASLKVTKFGTSTVEVEMEKNDEAC